jgi:predicted ATPase/DNA-binding SARP family transcriptional activator
MTERRAAVPYAARGGGGVDGGGLRFGVLGPVRAQFAGEGGSPDADTAVGADIDLGGPAPRTVLAVLLAARGRVVTAERLADDLWAGDPPPSATVTLHGYVSRLRRALEPGRPPRAPSTVLLRQGPGYVIPVSAGPVDAELFTRAAADGSQLLREGAAAQALQRLDAALALWRGPAYAECADAEFALPEIARLDGLRLAAREDRLAALVQVRGSAAAVPELEAFTAEEPLRERGWELLALALYRSGRQTDALAALRSARRTLSDDYGLDPGPTLQRLEAAVLAQDPSLDLPEPAPASPDRSGSGPPRQRRAGDALPTTSEVGDDERAGLPTATQQPEHSVPADGGPGSNLPKPLTTFVGRAAQLAVLGRLLDEHRLVTLTGTGGTGKTRLALEAAARRELADGPWFVDVSGLHDADLLVEEVATVLGVAAGGSATALAATLRTRQTLLVLDNCEHVIEATAELAAALLSRCPGLQVLATSREPLGIPGENVLDVPPMELETEAVELFGQRAAAQVPGWEPTAAELSTVRHICAELDGIPLALELAAGQCRVLSVDQVAGHLEDRFSLLQNGSRAGVQRHRTLETAIEWSYSTLDDDSRRLFGMLGIFEGGFDLSAAAAIGGVTSPLRGVSTLVTKSLLTVEQGTDPRRYRMLQSLRQFGAVRLDPVDRERAERRHREWFLALAEEGSFGMRGRHSAEWMARLEREMPNARAAMAGALAAGDPLTAQRIAAALSWFWYRRAHVAEGTRWLVTALAAGGADRPGAAHAHFGLGMLHYLGGDLEGGFRHARTARELAAAGGDSVTDAVATTYMSYFFAYSGDLDSATRTADEGLALARGSGVAWPVADALMVRGQVLRSTGDADAALAVLDEAAARAQHCGHGWAAISALWIGAKVSMDLGRPEVAASRGRAMALSLAAEGDRSSWLVALHLLAGALGMLDRAEEGAVLLGAVDSVGQQVGYHPRRMDTLDSPRNEEAVRSRLAPARFADLHAHGAALATGEVTELVRGLELPAVEDIAASVA